MSLSQEQRQAFVEEDLARAATKLDLSRLDQSSIVITGASGFMGILAHRIAAHPGQVPEAQAEALPAGH